MGFEGRAVQSGLPVDVRDRERPRRVVRAASRIPYAPPKILGSKVPENFYLLPLHSSLFTENAPENFEVIGNSEELKSGSYIDSDSFRVSPPPTKTSSEQGEVFVYPSRRLGISSDFGLYLITVGVSHHALACIHLRLDDIQHVVLVIYKTPF